MNTTDDTRIEEEEESHEEGWYPTPLECDECTPWDSYPDEHGLHCKYFEQYFENGPYVA